ncbi:DUF3088 family protein [Xanthomonas citri pv. mangiferaeindicae]|uniref:DUF3088 family protein n=1 Tax=Xanthomonas citri TaxID=346 RepID=UPI0002F173EA|nr:DUF3088 family protein [Xanthomonas citri]OOW55474.1 hypothetical protein Xcnt_01030 [Xanthomonas campestris pv. centellae]UDB87847.1 DUF3088 domain-containing protein [Xanthomonas citri pv. mangiferaeindicae]UDI83417.1 hypothetical protein XCM_20505 [Xanthomonas citri pv. mangiferaeindicae]
MSNPPVRDTLFLADTAFAVDGAGPFYCGDCIAIEGLLSIAPAIAQGLEIRRLAFPRPRQVLVDLLGEQQQSLPVLVLAGTDVEVAGSKSAGHYRVIDDEAAIRAYLSHRFAVARQR